MEMPKPTEAHKKFALMAGRWTGEECISPSPWDPKGGTAKSRSDNRVALNGFVLLHDYEQERNGAVTFRGHGVLSFDSPQQCYVMHWWDSTGSPVNEFKGKFDGPVLEMTSSGPQGLNRVLWDFSRAGRYRFKMDVSPDGKQWMTFMEGNSARDSELGG
jgi:hypothetical protein